MTFINERQMMDAVMIANELVDSRVKCKQPGILCKLDIQKAYGYLNWNYLVSMLALELNGFDGSNYALAVIFSVLINRSPTGSFTSQRGLR